MLKELFCGWVTNPSLKCIMILDIFILVQLLLIGVRKYRPRDIDEVKHSIFTTITNSIV